MITLARDYAAPQITNPFWGMSYGVSEDAFNLGGQLRKIIGSCITGSATGSKRFSEALHSLQEIADESSTANWDGDGAAPVSPEAVLEAESLLFSLPTQITMPDIFAEGTGSIAFEWCRAKDYRFVIAVSGNSTIEYAGLLGPGNTVYGECLVKSGLPKLIRDHLLQLFS